MSPAVSAVVFNAACYATGWKVMGKDFVIYSIISSIGFSSFYAVFEQFGPIVAGTCRFTPACSHIRSYICRRRLRSLCPFRYSAAVILLLGCVFLPTVQSWATC
ncbi:MULTISPECIES: YitT family protein [Bacillaceae]|uniref:YitT family protein n=1 Tax=Bacillaceae TaxID=186817 RepID=UPI00190F0C00|nr:YitT family protein [Caldifermentibacillus hisashii]